MNQSKWTIKGFEHCENMVVDSIFFWGGREQGGYDWYRSAIIGPPAGDTGLAIDDAFGRGNSSPGSPPGSSEFGIA